jgi:hypothetical protein
MAAQLEETFVGADRIGAQQVAEDLVQLPFELALRRAARIVAVEGKQARRRQLLAVDLAARIERHLGHLDEDRRHHVGRQEAAEVGPQLAFVGPQIVLEAVVGDDP